MINKIPAEVKERRATGALKVVRSARNNCYLKEQEVPELREIRIRLSYGDQPKLKGTGQPAI